MSLVSEQPEHIDLKVPGGKGVVLLAFTYNALHDLNNRLVRALVIIAWGSPQFHVTHSVFD